MIIFIHEIEWLKVCSDCLYICLPVCLYVCCLFFCLCVHRFVCLFVCLFMLVSMFFFIIFGIKLFYSVRLVCLFVCLSVCKSVCQFIWESSLSLFMKNTTLPQRGFSWASKSTKNQTIYPLQDVHHSKQLSAIFPSENIFFFIISWMHISQICSEISL